MSPGQRRIAAGYRHLYPGNRRAVHPTASAPRAKRQELLPPEYNVEKTLARFAATARDEVELEVLAAALINVVNETMQPAIRSLWLAPSQHPAGKQLVQQDNEDAEYPDT